MSLETFISLRGNPLHIFTLFSLGARLIFELLHFWYPWYIYALHISDLRPPSHADDGSGNGSETLILRDCPELHAQLSHVIPT